MCVDRSACLRELETLSCNWHWFITKPGRERWSWSFEKHSLWRLNGHTVLQKHRQKVHHIKTFLRERLHFEVLEMCEISLNDFFLIFTCDSPFVISAAENGLILRYTFKCSFSRSDGSLKRNIKARSISVEHFINHKKHTFMNKIIYKVMAICHLTWKIEQSLNSEDRFFLISSTTIISGLAASPFSPDSIILL